MDKNRKIIDMAADPSIRKQIIDEGLAISHSEAKRLLISSGGDINKLREIKKKQQS